jgi:ATP-dependent phosphofructokinase / diphosphate-dependent phosphofructokinase
MANVARIGILTGGGDVPGLNVAIKAVVGRAADHGIEVVGLRRGWASVMGIDPDDPATVAAFTLPLDHETVRRIDRTGGTMLHSSRTNPVAVKASDVPSYVRAEDQVTRDDGKVDCTKHAIRVLNRLGLDALVPIGGEDTLSFAERLSREGFPAIAIPKTMDNDVLGTDYCIGFSTTITRSVEMITNFRTALGSHERIGIIELFGRHSGGTSLYAALLAAVDRAIIPEVPFNMERLAGFLADDREGNPSHYSMVTISEGAVPEGGDITEGGEADAFGHRKLGGIGIAVSQEIKRITGTNVMFQQLGYVIRSGAPDTLDRMVANSFGILAADEVAKGHTGKLVALQGGRYTTVPLTTVAGGQRKIDVAELYDAEQYRPKVRDIQDKPMFLY